MALSNVFINVYISFIVLMMTNGVLAQQQNPVITSLPPSIDLDVDQNTPIVLATPDCTDPLGNDTVLSILGILPGAPCADCFEINICPTAEHRWCLTFEPKDQLDITRTPEYELSIMCEALDNSSINFDIQDVKITLQKIYKPPVFDNFISVVTIMEEEKREILLSTIRCTDPNKGPVSVGMKTPADPAKGLCADCFTVLPCNTGDWCLKYLPSVGTLKFEDTPVYSIDVTCTDEDGNSTTSVVEVRVRKNTPPVFGVSSLIDVLTVENTMTVTAFTDLYTVLASDSDNDTIYYRMEQNPDYGMFEIGYTDGIIRAKTDLSQACFSVVTWSVYITDNVNLEQGPLVITTTLNGANKVPIITNMNEQIQVVENFVGGIYAVNVIDEDVLNLTYVLTFNPASAQAYFFFRTFDQPPSLRVTTALDYEAANPGRIIRLQLKARDVGGCISEAKDLTIVLTNENEKPDFSKNEYAVITDEGQIRLDPVWTFTDPDIPDGWTYSIVGGASAGLFDIDPKTGVITSLVEYDIDQNRMPTTATVTVRITDQGGLTDDTRIVISVRDVNDNPPVITPGPRSWTVTECTQPGTILGRLEATDMDSSFETNNITNFVPATSGYIAVLADGQIVLTTVMRPGTVTSLTVYAQDQGQRGTLRSVPAIISVRSTECPPPTTTTTTTTTTSTTTTLAPSTTPVTYYFDWTEENLPWIIASAILGTLLLALVAYMCVRYARCFRCPKVSPKAARPQMTPVKTMRAEPKPVNHSNPPRAMARPASPPKPNVVGPQDGYLHDFWKEKYEEDDILGHPNRNTKPEPMKSYGPTNNNAGAAKSSEKGCVVM